MTTSSEPPVSIIPSGSAASAEGAAREGVALRSELPISASPPVPAPALRIVSALEPSEVSDSVQEPVSEAPQVSPSDSASRSESPAQTGLAALAARGTRWQRVRLVLGAACLLLALVSGIGLAWGLRAERPARRELDIEEVVGAVPNESAFTGTLATEPALIAPPTDAAPEAIPSAESSTSDSTIVQSALFAPAGGDSSAQPVSGVRGAWLEGVIQDDEREPRPNLDLPPTPGGYPTGMR